MHALRAACLVRCSPALSRCVTERRTVLPCNSAGAFYMMPSMFTKSKQADGTTNWQSTGHCTSTTTTVSSICSFRDCSFTLHTSVGLRLVVHTAHPVVSRLDVHTAHNFCFATGRSHCTRLVYPHAVYQCLIRSLSPQLLFPPARLPCWRPCRWRALSPRALQ